MVSYSGVELQIGAQVEWLTGSGSFGGIIVETGVESAQFPGEGRWVVQFPTGETRELESRDLRVATGWGPGDPTPAGWQIGAAGDSNGDGSAGADTRDLAMDPTFVQQNLIEGEEVQYGGAIVPVTTVLARLAAPIASRFVTWITGAGYAVGSRIGWSTMPGWIKAALTLVGFGAVDISIDSLQGIGGNGGGGGAIVPFDGGAGGIGLPGVGIVGSWVANGVTFYRLSDGRIAVKRKNGTWKVWKPKSPIVIYGDGAGDLKTFLRADGALNRQAKRLQSALNRRAPKPRRSKKEPVTVVVDPIAASVRAR